ncbi:MAG: hypothetical protein A2V81_03630 [Candidatus Abawacabacteria bacterium RBG_16_42_10]|uniref:MPN domain-containing protein n=1 Tax=Candidatus Abawacabacteria bacterium RBG_16_42_10 TaxID=1817814 RepID=A0A1F4XJW8_9BACT|nr:MAG: hypothetical protein A2V81_03630 [Candidatus Abawacabacteria bacterium RBG_16_42_10]
MSKHKQQSSDDLSNYDERGLWKIIVGKELSSFLESKQTYLLHSLSSISHIEQITSTGLPTARKIAATLELGRRIFRYTPESPTLNSPFAVYRYTRGMLEQKQEMIRAIYLSSRLTIVCDEIIAIGKQNSAFIGIRELFRPAFVHNAHTFILVHNHPSGDPTASEEDIAMTKYIATMSHMLSLSLQDHIIVAQNGFVSVREKYPEIFSVQNAER